MRASRAVHSSSVWEIHGSDWEILATGRYWVRGGIIIYLVWFWFCIQISLKNYSFESLTGCSVLILYTLINWYDNIMTFRKVFTYMYIGTFCFMQFWLESHHTSWHIYAFEKKKWSKLFLKMFPNIFEKKNSKIILWSPNDDLPVDQSIQNKNGTPVKYVLFFFSRSVFKSPWSTWLWFHFMIDIRSIPYQAWTGVSLPGVDR